MQHKFYKATNDKVFKAIFLPEQNWNLVKRLIEDATKIKDIEIISVVSPELPKDNIINKGKTLDVVVRSKDHIINIEVNVYNDIIFHRRNFAYLATEYSNDLAVGNDYDSMKDHIQINITVSTSSNIPDYDMYVIKGERHNQLFIDNFAIYEFNLLKMKDVCYNDYRFVQMLTYEKEELEEKCIGDKEMEQFKSELERVNSDNEFIQLMTADEEEKKYLNTVKNLEYKAGIKEGIEQGIEQKSKDIALKMLEKGIDIESISEITGLSKEEVESLKSE